MKKILGIQAALLIAGVFTFSNASAYLCVHENGGFKTTTYCETDEWGVKVKVETECEAGTSICSLRFVGSINAKAKILIDVDVDNNGEGVLTFPIEILKEKENALFKDGVFNHSTPIQLDEKLSALLAEKLKSKNTKLFIERGRYSYVVKGNSIVINHLKIVELEALENYKEAMAKLPHTPPQNTNPANGKTFTQTEAKQPLNFKWVPLIPPIIDGVTYKVRVFEVRKGQPFAEAIKMGKPLVEKETANQTQLCCLNFNIGGGGYAIAKGSSYVWYVEATDKQGKILGSSTPTGFAVELGEKTLKEAELKNHLP